MGAEKQNKRFANVSRFCFGWRIMFEIRLSLIEHISKMQRKFFVASYEGVAAFSLPRVKRICEVEELVVEINKLKRFRSQRSSHEIPELEA